MSLRASTLPGLLGLAAIGSTASAHDAFLPLHEHRPAAHSHGSHVGSHEHPHRTAGDGKHAHGSEDHGANRWVVATGAQYTRYSVDSSRAELWETGLGFEFALLPWLHVGGDVSYGWFDSALGNTSGWMLPHAHVDAHIPLDGDWELLIGGTVGFPGGDEALVGDHWELEPHLELSYDRHTWFARAGAGFVFSTGGTSHDHAEDHPEDHAGEEDHDEEEGHDHEEHEALTGDFHDITHPHGETEFTYYGAAGVRFLDERLSVEARLSGVHVVSGDTADRNFLRAGLLASLRFSEQTSVTAQVSIPITDAERNRVQASLGFRVEF